MKKLLTVALLSLCMAAVLATPAFASSTGWSGPCPPYRTGVDLATGTHDTSTNQATVTLSNMGGDYSRMYFTVRRNADGYEDVTSTKLCSEGYDANLPYTKTVATNSKLILNGGNDKWTIVNVDASGKINFN